MRTILGWKMRTHFSHSHKRIGSQDMEDLEGQESLVDGVKLLPITWQSAGLGWDPGNRSHYVEP